MKKILFIILAIALASCKGTDEDMELRRYQYFIYNKSGHNVDINELKTKTNTVVRNHHLSIDDSTIIITEYSDDLVSPFGAGDVIIIFDDTLKYNCSTHDFKTCCDPISYKSKFCNDTITAMEYSITDDDYNKIVNILKEEQ